MTNFASGYCETLPVVIDAAGCGLANPFGVRGIPPETFPGDGARAPDLVRQLRETVLGRPRAHCIAGAGFAACGGCCHSVF